MNPFDWRILGAVLLGGGLGSVLRYATYFFTTQRLGPGFPYGTLAINVIGSILIGVVFELSQTRAVGLSPLIRIFLMTGVLGGFTTFSTFSLDSVLLAREQPLLALGYACGSVALGFLGAFGGIVAVRSLQP